MTKLHIPRIVIAGVSSGVGKTTIVTGLLATLARQGVTVQSYKVGPDYIDPGYHSLATGNAAHNLDTWLVPSDKLASIFAKTASGNDLAIIEGVMGLYDGGRAGISSTAAIAKLLDAPVVLVVDAKSVGESIAATVLGYKMYDSNVHLAGVIINRIGSDSHKAIVCEAIERIGVKVLGCVTRNGTLALPERHLGLTPVTENDAHETVEAIAKQISNEIDIEQIVHFAQSAKPLIINIARQTESFEDGFRIRIGVAHDEAFSFYYPESLEVLSSQGAELIYFSPLHDSRIPDVDGIILGGGFPEMFAEKLADNGEMRKSIYTACMQGMPVYAECGGFMYLTREITDFSGKSYAMVGAIPATSVMESKLQTVGYVEARALSDNILCGAGDKIRGHEFHFSRILPDTQNADFNWAFQMEKARTGASYPGGFASGNLLASYLHMHFAGNETAARNFINKCKTFRRRRGKV